MNVESLIAFTASDQDGAAILDIHEGTISTLNATGAYVWQGLERGETVETIVATLAHETGEPLSTVERDVREFVKALEQLKLLPN